MTAPFPPGTMYGLRFCTFGGTEFTISPGCCRDSTDAINMILEKEFRGDVAGAPDGTFHFFAVAPESGEITIIASQTLTPEIAEGVYSRRVGSIWFKDGHFPSAAIDGEWTVRLDHPA